MRQSPVKTFIQLLYNNGQVTACVERGRAHRQRTRKFDRGLGQIMHD